MVFILVLYIFLIFLIFLAIKNNNTTHNQSIICWAIYEYNAEMITEGCSCAELAVDVDDMESYYRTLFRLWDWGYTRILPRDKFELVKSYIKE